MSRTATLGIVLACLGMPPAFVLVSGASHYLDNRTTGTIVIGTAERDYIVHVPDTYDGARPVPLVLSLHGATTWPSLQKNLSGWNDIADKNGFIVAYPGGGDVFFRSFGRRDVPFISNLIDRLQADYNIDRNRIYVNGLSNGGGMSYLLSCELAGRFAAVGAVAPAILWPADICPDAPAVPLVVFHGTGDRWTPYDGGKVFVAPDPFPPIPVWTANWARRNHCAPQPRQSAVASDVTRIEYDNCAEPVILFKIDNGGHTWPGGAPLAEWFAGRTTRNIDATEVMWSFFKEHSLPH